MLQLFTFTHGLRGRKRLLLILWVLLCYGCASGPKTPGVEEQQEKLAAVMEKGGYTAANGLQIVSHREVWSHDGEDVELMLTSPVSGGPYPLIIYLPSLGEDAAAGKLWRETWAKAGYAVFSLQAVSIGQALKELGPERNSEPRKGGLFSSADDDEADVADAGDKRRNMTKRHSKSGRSSELRYLGHEYFSPTALKKRMQQLFWAFQQLQIRKALGAPEYAFVDTGKVILAGYDLGAQTVTAVLGEDFMTQLPSDDSLQPIAALVFSPSIDLAEGNVRNRFQKIHIPLLVVTGSEDNDPYAISSASIRSAVWEFSPAGGKYLLSLSGNVHGLLAGGNFGGGLVANGGGEDDNAADKSSAGKPGDKLLDLSNHYGGSGGRRQAGNSDSFFGGPKQAGKRDKSELGYKQVAAVYSISTAFLDAVVKNDDFAKFWLKDKARDWLNWAGELKVR
jgi:hypothetical protein